MSLLDPKKITTANKSTNNRHTITISSLLPYSNSSSKYRKTERILIYPYVLYVVRGLMLSA